jgi:hypothetical protein
MDLGLNDCLFPEEFLFRELTFSLSPCGCAVSVFFCVDCATAVGLKDVLLSFSSVSSFLFDIKIISAKNINFHKIEVDNKNYAEN